MLLSFQQIQSAMKSLVSDGPAEWETERRGDSLVNGTIVNGCYRIEERIEGGGAGPVFTVTLVQNGRMCPLCHRKMEGTHNLFCNHFGVELNGQVFQMEVFRGHIDSRLIRKLSEISHPNIARIYDIFSLGCNTHVVSEYSPGVTMDRLEGTITAEHIRMIGICLAQIVKFLHSQGICGLNLQPHNLRFVNDSPVLISLSTCRLKETFSGQDLERSRRDDCRHLLETLEKLAGEYGDPGQGHMLCRLLVALEEMIGRDQLCARDIQETLTHS